MFPWEGHLRIMGIFTNLTTLIHELIQNEITLKKTIIIFTIKYLFFDISKKITNQNTRQVKLSYRTHQHRL